MRLFHFGFIFLITLFLSTSPSLLLAATPSTTTSSGKSVDPEDDRYQDTLLLTRVIELIRQEYVDESKVSYKDLTYAALKGILSSLDPHSQFLDEDSFAEMQRDTKGEFSGLGLVVGMKGNTLVVIAPMENTPGFRAGILPGDHILKIDGKSTEKLSLASAVRLLRGQNGEKIKMTLLRPHDSASKTPEVFEVELTRETIKVATVHDARLLPVEIAGDAKIGYVRIEQFGDNTADELEAALDKLEVQGMQSLVIDLRNNPGGLLDAAVETAGKFLPAGQVIVSTKGRTADQSFEYRARGTKKHLHYPIVVLINNYSASGAEIVAGALKDLNRAIVLGETTFGKGSVQSVQDLGNGIGLRLTTAKYYTPSKKVIHEVGVPPDILSTVGENEEHGLILIHAERPLNEEEQEEVKTFHDSQLERAVDILRGVRIYAQRQETPAEAKANSTAH